MESFDMISFKHVYMENNYQADFASKAGLLLDPGLWKVKERLGDEEFAYYHQPFFDLVVTWWLFLFFDDGAYNFWI